MGFLEINATAAQQAIGYMGRLFEFRGATYKAVINEFTADPSLEVGALMPNYSAVIYVRKNGFPVPEVGELVSVDGREYRIASVQSDPISYTLNVQDPTQ